MTSIDWSPIIQAIIAGIGLVLTALIGVFVPRALAAFEARTGIALTEQQRATVLGAATTAAGIIQTKIDQGLIPVREVSTSNPTVMQEAQAAVSRVPKAAEALKTSPSAMAAIIVGKVDTSPAAVSPMPVVVSPGPRTP